MANDENEQLRKEVERQTRIIDALLDNNTQLKQALAWCRHLLAHPPQPVSSNDTGGNAIPQKKDDMQSENDGVNQMPDSAFLLIDGVIQTFDYIHEQMIGVNQSPDTYPLQKNGVNHLQDIVPPAMYGVNLPTHALPVQNEKSVPEKNDPDNDAPSATQQKDTPAKPAFDFRKLAEEFRCDDKVVALFSITPQEIAEGRMPVSYFKLMALLRKLIPKASDGGLMNTAQIMMQLHLTPAQSLKSLQKLTHLSEDGITKRIMAMKKFGLIVRAPGRQLLLTPKARQLMDEAR